MRNGSEQILIAISDRIRSARQVRASSPAALVSVAGAAIDPKNSGAALNGARIVRQRVFQLLRKTDYACEK